MKLLLDEHLPHKLRHEIIRHDVLTIAFMGWSGAGNGALLQQAAAAGFNALVTNDRGMEYEQFVGALPVAVVILQAPANTIEAIRPLLPALHACLAALQPCALAKLATS